MVRKDGVEFCTRLLVKDSTRHKPFLHGSVYIGFVGWANFATRHTGSDPIRTGLESMDLGSGFWMDTNETKPPVIPIEVFVFSESEKYI